LKSSRMIGRVQCVGSLRMNSRRKAKTDEKTGARQDADGDLTLLKGAVENTNEAFVTIDRNHRVLFFNKAAERIFGFGREEVIGHDLDVIMSPTCSRDHRRAVERYIETKVPTRIGHETEIFATRSNGERFPASISFSVAEVEGEIYFTGIVRDLTETKALQDRILKSERLAGLGQVVAEITHEIKNPLMMIGGLARQVMRETRDEKDLEKFDIIVGEVLRLEDLLKELRDVYLPRDLDTEQMDMVSLLREVCDLVKANCESKRILLVFRTEGEQLLVAGDRAKLKQVFLNLLKNAMESMENGGHLIVGSRVSGDLAEVTLSDEGCGIPESDHKKVFSPFFTKKRRGTGLGLSISKRIIEDHPGGSITFTSEETKGTTFKVTMPICRAGSKNVNMEKERKGI
jgi:two-component system sensor kinase FixL